ncbi:MAG: hypothetical protein K9I48_07675 [Sphingobacteriales bacterium]|jgi:hypothetical protein|nr:hypothetical protein [Sphingobacteriales bacterium]
MFINSSRILPVVLLLLITISSISCQTVPIRILEKKFTVNKYLSPNREPNLNVHDYSCVFVANVNSKSFKIIDVKCNNEAAKLFLLNSKSMIVSEFNKNDTILLRSSIIRENSNPSKDTIAVFYKYKGRLSTMFISDFQKIETPINQ